MKSETEILIEFNEKLQKVIDPVILGEAFKSRDPQELFLVFSFGKAFKTHSAILILCKAGYGQDAAILTRSLFELLVTTLYILGDTTRRRAERWFDYDWIRRAKMYEYMKSEDRFIELLNEKKKSSKEDHAIKIKQKAQEMQEKYNYVSKLGWSDRSIFDMAKEVDLESLYPTVYKLQTDLHHSGVGSMNDYFSEEGEEIIADIGPSHSWVEETLVASFHFFHDLIEKLNESFSLSVHEEIREIQESFKEHMKQVNKGTL